MFFKKLSSLNIHVYLTEINVLNVECQNRKKPSSGLAGFDYDEGRTLILYRLTIKFRANGTNTIRSEPTRKADTILIRSFFNNSPPIKNELWRHLVSTFYRKTSLFGNFTH